MRRATAAQAASWPGVGGQRARIRGAAAALERIGPDAILAVAYIGFLGFGLHYPNLDWGDMISDGVGYMQDGYWWLIYPVGICIVLTVMALNFIGDALRDSLDVRLRRR